MCILPFFFTFFGGVHALCSAIEGEVRYCLSISVTNNFGNVVIDQVEPLLNIVAHKMTLKDSFALEGHSLLKAEPQKNLAIFAWFLYFLCD